MFASLQKVLRKALTRDGLRRGLHESTKALERRSARLCCLAADCEVAALKQLVKALCETNGIPLIECVARVRGVRFGGPLCVRSP